MLKTDKKYFMTKADIYFLVGLLAAALFILLFFRWNREKGSYIEVSYDGVTFWEIPLLQQEERYFLLTDQTLLELTKDADMEWEALITQTETENQTKTYNIFVCQNGKVQMVKGNCPDRICVQHYPISATGENIICLPHKVVIAITGAKENELDGVAY